MEDHLKSVCPPLLQVLGRQVMRGAVTGKVVGEALGGHMVVLLVWGELQVTEAVWSGEESGGGKSGQPEAVGVGG